MVLRSNLPIPSQSGDHRYLIAQWKREIGPEAVGDFSPFLALRLNQGKLFATVETNYVAPCQSAQGASTVQACGNNQTPVWFRPDTNQMRALIATDANWTPQDGKRVQQLHRCDRRDRPGQQTAGTGLRLD